MKPSKYKNKKVKIDGHTFDSKKEASRYLELKAMEEAGDIKGLQLQVPYLLQPKFINAKTGKTVRAIYYKADFTYLKDGELIIEDVKSPITRDNPLYIMKKKMMMYNGWYITEV